MASISSVTLKPIRAKCPGCKSCPTSGSIELAARVVTIPGRSPMPSKAITRRAVVQGGALLVGATTLSTLPPFAQGHSPSPVAKPAGGEVEKSEEGRKGVLLMNRIAPSSSDLYIANVDGSGERKFLDTPAYDYNAAFAADGQSV